MIQSKPLPPCWQQHLSGEFKKPYMKSLNAFLKTRKDSGAKIYPSKGDLFRAFFETKFDDVKVVLLGQDPYHRPGQAHGLSFSVPDGVRVPPSLRNIYKEIQRDFDVSPELEPFQSGELHRWSGQGVLLLNSVLTVEEGKAGSHQKKGWEEFTDAVIRCLAQEKKGLVFFLWGSYAQKKAGFLSKREHCILETVHPSPLSAYRGFLGCDHFSTCNLYLKKTGQKQVSWF